MRLLASGTRYRFATGVRAAMGVWGTLLIAYVIARGLHGEPPLLLWGAGWTFPLAVAIGLPLAAAPLLARVMRFDAQLDVLPLSPRQRLAIDLATVALFVAPPHLSLLLVMLTGGVLHALAAVPLLALGDIAVASYLRTTQRPPLTMARRHAPARARTFAHDLRWLLRTSGRDLVNAELFATLTALAGELAIRNNGVSHLAPILRIESLFAALAAGILASAVVRGRNAARTYRSIEASLPLDAATRLRALLAATAPLLVPPFAVTIALHPRNMLSAAYAALTFALIVLLGEDAALRHRRNGEMTLATIGAAVAAAVDVRLGFLLVIAALPFAWRSTLHSNAHCDLPVSRAEEAA